MTGASPAIAVMFSTVMISGAATSVRLVRPSICEMRSSTDSDPSSP